MCGDDAARQAEGIPTGSDLLRGSTGKCILCAFKGRLGDEGLEAGTTRVFAVTRSSRPARVFGTTCLREQGTREISVEPAKHASQFSSQAVRG
jgi:hypothetical protein